jgi:hypothetical protein
MTQLLNGAVVEARLMGMAFSPDERLGVDALLMGQIRLSAAAAQPMAQPTG